MNLFSSLQRQSQQPGAAQEPTLDTAALQARAKAWVRAALALDDSVAVTVTELRCPAPGCPDVETVVGVLLTSPRRIDKYAVAKALREVTREDIAVACSRGANSGSAGTGTPEHNG